MDKLPMNDVPMLVSAINIKVNFMAEYSFAPLPHTPMRRYIGISATS